MRSFRERTPWIAGGLVVLAVLLVARIDLAETRNKIPPIPPPCASDAIGCNEARNAKFFPRLQEMRRLDKDFDGRAWIYAILATAGMVGAAIVAVGRHSSGEGQRRVFSSAGVAGVVLGLAGVALLVMSEREIKPPTGAVFLPCLALVAFAGVGRSVSRLQTLPSEVRERPKLDRERATRGGGRVAIAAFACTCLTVTLGLNFAAHQPGGCNSSGQAPVWASLVGWGGVVTAVAAGILALVTLAAKRWFVALFCFVVNPAALLYMLLSTGVAC